MGKVSIKRMFAAARLALHIINTVQSNRVAESIHNINETDGLAYKNARDEIDIIPDEDFERRLEEHLSANSDVNEEPQILDKSKKKGTRARADSTTSNEIERKRERVKTIRDQMITQGNGHWIERISKKDAERYIIADIEDNDVYHEVTRKDHISPEIYLALQDSEDSNKIQETKLKRRKIKEQAVGFFGIFFALMNKVFMFFIHSAETLNNAVNAAVYSVTGVEVKPFLEVLKRSAGSIMKVLSWQSFIALILFRIMTSYVKSQGGLVSRPFHILSQIVKI